MKDIVINNVKIGLSHKPYFIADIAANHDGDINRAIKLIELAKIAGANAAKFQNFKADKIVNENVFKELGGLSHQSKWDKSVFEVYQDASIPDDWTPILKAKCDEFEIEYMTSPYDFDSVEWANKFVNCFKVGSGDITWTDIILKMAEKNKPLLIATGASSFEDVDRIMTLLNKKDVILMQCNTNYTASKDNFKFINLNVLKKYQENYPNCVLGLSDHTKGYSTVLGAISLGARVIEKHFTDDINRKGPDHAFSTTPLEWREMVNRAVECFYSLGDGIKNIEENEKQTYFIQRRAIYAKKRITKGDIICENDLNFLRPYNEKGFHPYEKNSIIGKNANVNIEKGKLISKENLQC